MTASLQGSQRSAETGVCAAGATLECRWGRVETAGNSHAEGAKAQKPLFPDAEQLAAERGRQWHSWHLNRLELPAWQRPISSGRPSMEARAVLRGLSGRLSSLQASVFMPL